MQLATLRSMVQRDTTWFLMPVRMSLCCIPGIRILIVIMHSNSTLAQNQQVQVQRYQVQAQEQPRQETTNMDAEEFVNRITTMMQS